jgi:hypothetical protein
MQAKIIDFASDKLVKSLRKIDKDDVKNAYANISSKLRKGKSSATKDGAKVTSSEEYCEMLKDEFNFSPDELGKPKCDEKNKQAESVLLVEENSDGKAFRRNKILYLKLCNKAQKAFALFEIFRRRF